jgi:predicted DNA-binding transcriptional regulator YafY
MWYLVAYCTANEGMRFFRLDRVEGLQTAEGTFERMAAELPEARFYSSGEQVATMTIRYSPRIARWIAEREGLELAADGSLTVERPLSDEHWAVRHVLQYGPEGEVMAPASLRESVAERLEVMTEMLPSANRAQDGGAS